MASFFFKKAEEQPEETEPLLQKSDVEVAKVEEQPEEEPSRLKSIINWFLEHFAVYDAPDENYKCELNPSPLRLLGLNLGFGFMEIMSVLGAYMFLNTHMQTMFPKCSNYPVIDRMLGTNIGHGVLCEICSILLWTFPLMCCLLVPWFHYWEFTDSRLYYECLRAKLLVQFNPREFFFSPTALYLFVYLFMGTMVLVFGSPATYREWKMKAVVIFSFMLPIGSFIATVYMNWDIKYFLITLANFVDKNVPWAKSHLGQCYAVSEDDLAEAYHAIKEDKLDKLENPTSDMVFSALYEEIKSRRMKEAEEKACQSTAAEILSKEDLERMKRGIEEGKKRMIALLLWRKGFWLTDLLWMPQDKRGREFRLFFRLFAVGVALLQLATIYMLVTTVIMYLCQQGWIESSSVRELLWVKDFVVKELADEVKEQVTNTTEKYT